MKRIIEFIFGKKEFSFDRMKVIVIMMNVWIIPQSLLIGTDYWVYMFSVWCFFFLLAINEFIRYRKGQ